MSVDAAWRVSYTEAQRNTAPLLQVRQAEAITQKMEGELFTEKIKSKELEKRATRLDEQVSSLSASLAKERKVRPTRWS